MAEWESIKNQTININNAYTNWWLDKDNIGNRLLIMHWKLINIR